MRVDAVDHGFEDCFHVTEGGGEGLEKGGSLGGVDFSESWGVAGIG